MSYLNLVCKITNRYRPFLLYNTAKKIQVHRNLHSGRPSPSSSLEHLQPKCKTVVCQPSKWDVLGKNVVITGGCSGLLLEAAKNMVICGACRVALWDIKKDDDKGLRMIREDYPCRDIRWMNVDVSKKDQVDEAFQTLMHQWKRIDIIIAGSGIMEECNLEKTVATNLTGIMYTVLGGIEHMSIKNCAYGGVIVVLTSVAALDPMLCTPIATGSYHGALGFTDSLANEFYRSLTGIQFVSMCPAMTDTCLYKNWPDNILYQEARQVTTEALSKMPIQSPEKCGENIVRALRESYNGSIWILDDEKYYEVTKTKYWLWEKENECKEDDTDESSDEEESDTDDD